MSSPETAPSAEPSVPGPYESLHDISCPVAVLLGHRSITVRECLELRPNSVLALRRPVGADLEIRVNGVLVAHGEVVIVEESTSIKVTTFDLSDERGG